jgi:uncharacterized protein
MIDLTAIDGFEWDDGDARRSLLKRGVRQAEAEQVFAGEPLLAEDFLHGQAGARFQALGETAEGRPLHVTFTPRGDGKKICVISARDMNRKERTYYEQKT